MTDSLPVGPAPAPWSCVDCDARFTDWHLAEQHVEKTGHRQIDLILCRPAQQKETQR